MTEARYQIVFAGEPLPGVTLDALKDNLCRLFKSDRGSIERLFSGSHLPLKRGLTAVEAERYLQALERAGARAYKTAEPDVSKPAQPVTAFESAIPVESMTCPKCGHQQDKSQTCSACGIVIEKFLARQALSNAAAMPGKKPVDSADSPYAPPQAQLGEPLPEFGELKVFTSNGRIGRLRYLAWQLVLGLSMIPLALLAVAGATVAPWVGISLLLVIATCLIIVSVLIGIQRLHDMGWSGWLILLYLVPLVGGLLPFLLMLVSGSQGANRYGPPPPPNGTAVKVLAALWLIAVPLAIIGQATNSLNFPGH